MATKRKPTRKNSRRRNPEGDEVATLPVGVMIPASSVMLNPDGSVSAVIDDAVLENVIRTVENRGRRRKPAKKTKSRRR